MVFAGDEVGVGGNSSDAGRQPFPWDESTWDHDLLATYRRLIALRRGVGALRRGGIRYVGRHGDAIAFVRETADETVLVHAAAGGPHQPLRIGRGDLGMTGAAERLYGDGELTTDATTVTSRRRAGVQRVADHRLSPANLGGGGTTRFDRGGSPTTSSTRRWRAWRVRPGVRRRPVEPRPDGGRGARPPRSPGRRRPLGRPLRRAARGSDRADRPPAGLGEMATVGDWERQFAAELAEPPWRRVVGRWVPRLAPGLMAAATHGWLRTAHAVRAVRASRRPSDSPSSPAGSAYWAARYQEVPGPTIPTGC